MVSKSALAWSLISDDGVDFSSTGNSFNDKELLQLKGLFQSLDHDRDGQLTEVQVCRAFDLLGIKPSLDTANVFVELQSVDFSAFVESLYAEKHRFRDFDAQLDLLLSFYDTDRTGFITKNDLKQLLCAPSSPFCFSDNDFDSFMATLEPKNSQKIGIEWIKQKLIFGSKL